MDDETGRPLATSFLSGENHAANYDLLSPQSSRPQNQTQHTTLQDATKHGAIGSGNAEDNTPRGQSSKSTISVQMAENKPMFRGEKEETLRPKDNSVINIANGEPVEIHAVRAPEVSCQYWVWYCRDSDKRSGIPTTTRRNGKRSFSKLQIHVLGFRKQQHKQHRCHQINNFWTLAEERQAIGNVLDVDCLRLSQYHFRSKGIVHKASLTKNRLSEGS